MSMRLQDEVNMNKTDINLFKLIVCFPLSLLVKIYYLYEMLNFIIFKHYFKKKHYTLNFLFHKVLL